MSVITRTVKNTHKWLVFNGVTGACAIPTTIPLSGTMSFALWVYITDLSASRVLFGTNNSGSGTSALLRVETNGSVSFFADTGGAATSWPAGTFAVNTLYHVGFTYDLGHAILYKNAVSQGSVVYTVAWVAGTARLQLGERSGSNDLAGYSADFGAWSGVALNATDFQNIMNGVPVSRTSMILEWLAKEGQGRTVHDTSGNNNHGILGVGVTWANGRPITVK